MKTIEFYNQQIKDFENLTFEERREAALKLDELKFHTKVTLKSIFRMKPAHNAINEYSYKNDYYQMIECFTINQCVPTRMRALLSKPRTPAQIAAIEKLAKTNRINSKENKAALSAKRMIEDDLIIIDTETTDLYGVVIQIAAVSSQTSKLLYKSLVSTAEPISEEAFAVHGITSDDIKDAPTFDTVAKELSAIIKDRKWSSFNLDFDDRSMYRSLPDNYDHEQSWLNNTDRCLMYLAADFFGPTNRYGSISLSNAMGAADIEWHRARCSE